MYLPSSIPFTACFLSLFLLLPLSSPSLLFSLLLLLHTCTGLYTTQKETTTGLNRMWSRP